MIITEEIKEKKIQQLMTHLRVWPQWSQVTFEVPTCHQLHDNQRRLALRNNTKQPNLEEEKQTFSYEYS